MIGSSPAGHYARYGLASVGSSAGGTALAARQLIFSLQGRKLAKLQRQAAQR
jgi:hypothetical protein